MQSYNLNINNEKSLKKVKIKFSYESLVKSDMVTNQKLCIVSKVLARLLILALFNKL